MASQKLMEFVTKRLIKEDDARSLIEPIRDDLVSVWTDSVSMWNALPEDARARLSEWSICPSFNRFCLCQSFAKERFMYRESEGIVPCDALQVFTFYVQNKILLRFNSIDRGHVVRNIDGDFGKEAYFNQAPIPGIDNAVTRLTCGPMMDAAKVNLASVVVSCQVGEDCLYWFPIDNAEMKVMPIRTPTAPREPKGLDHQRSAKVNRPR